jgi:hypothetical protein
MSAAWEQMVSDVLGMLGRRQVTPEQAESWLWCLVEFAEAS